MLERLEYVKVEPSLVVDAGCGTGTSLPGLALRFPGARVVGVEFVLAMLARAADAQAAATRLPRTLRRLFAKGATAPHPGLVAADFARLPLQDASVGCLWSNLALHWSNDVAGVLAEWHRVLAAGGLVQFSLLGPDSLKELRDATGTGGVERVHRFVDMHDIGDMLVDAGFADPVMDMEMLTLTYADIDRLFADLRGAGATNARADRERGLAGRGFLSALKRAYAKADDGTLAATFEVIYGHAWKPRGRAGADGVAVIRVEDIIRRR
jgi:malonyl-CoA O-methyltransferase